MTRIAVDGAALGSGRGGDETYLRAVLRGLYETQGGEDDLDVTVFSRRGISLGEQHDYFDWVHNTRVGPGRLMGPLGWQWRRGRFDAHVAYTHTPLGAPESTALIVTDLSFRHVPDMYPPRARRRLETLLPIQAKRAPAVLTLTEFCRADLIATIGLEPARVHVVPCSIDPVLELTSREISQVRVGLRERGVDGPYLLYLGNLHPRKNVAQLIHSFAQSGSARRGEAKLVIAGARWWDGGGEEAAIATCPTGSVVSLGRVSEEDREVLLRDAMLLAYPSLFEGFGLPPLEAMVRGTAVISSTRSALPEVLGDAAWLVDPTNRDELTSAIDTILGDDSIRVSFEKRGRQRASLYGPATTGVAARAALATLA